MFLSLFSSLTEGPPIDFVLLQDPPSSKGFLPCYAGFKSFAPPLARPSVACYVSQSFLQKFAILPFFPPETDDFMALDVFTHRGCFGSSFPRFRIGNTYPRPLPPNPHSVSPETACVTSNTYTSSQATSTSKMQPLIPPHSSPRRRKKNPPPILA